MKKVEKEILAEYDKGAFKSTGPSKAKLAKFKAAASATFLKEKRVNIRLSTQDLMDIQARALEEGMPYQIRRFHKFHSTTVPKIMKRSLLIALSVLLFGACATVSPPVPENYKGPTVQLADSGFSESGGKGVFFSATTLDGREIQNSLRETRGASYGKGFSLPTYVHYERGPTTCHM